MLNYPKKKRTIWIKHLRLSNEVDAFFHVGKARTAAFCVVSLMPELTKLKAAVGFTQQIPFSEGIRRMVQEKKGEI